MRPVVKNNPPTYPYFTVASYNNPLRFKPSVTRTRFNIPAPGDISVDTLLKAMLAVVKNGTYPDGTPAAAQSFPTTLVKRLDKEYGRARLQLAEMLGEYCAFCERPMAGDLLEVEHRAPKANYPTLYLWWGNFLLSCRGGCNQKKGDGPERDVARLWRVATASARAYRLTPLATFHPGSAADIDATAARNDAIAATGLPAANPAAVAAGDAAAMIAAADRIGTAAARRALLAGSNVATVSIPASNIGARPPAAAIAASTAALAAVQQTAAAIAPANPVGPVALQAAADAEQALIDVISEHFFWPDRDNNTHKRMKWVFMRDIDTPNQRQCTFDEMIHQDSGHVVNRDREVFMDLWDATINAVTPNTKVEVQLDPSIEGDFEQNRRTMKLLGLKKRKTFRSQARTRAWANALIFIRQLRTAVAAAALIPEKDAKFDEKFATLLAIAKLQGFFCTWYYLLRQCPIPIGVTNPPPGRLVAYQNMGDVFLERTSRAIYPGDEHKHLTIPGTNYTNFP